MEVLMEIKNKDGREIEVSVYGKYDDDIQIEEAYYTDDNSDASDEDIEYIYNTYGDELYQLWYESHQGIDFDSDYER